MKKLLFFLFSLSFHLCFSQQYDTVIIEKKNVDENNVIYQVGDAYIYDYEIIIDGKTSKLTTNKGMFSSRSFEFTPNDSSDLEVELICLLVQRVTDNERTNKNQTQISYLQLPKFASFSSTGVVENDNNIWIHPIRDGFFNALETAPFPFVKKPLKVGSQWNDEMRIGEGWEHELWGQWEGKLDLNYSYIITGTTILNTEIGDIECYEVEGKATSVLGTSELKAYFSEKYGFVRLEYTFVNDLKVNLWLLEVLNNQSLQTLKTKYTSNN